MNPILDLGWAQVAIAGGLVLVTALGSLIVRLGVAKDLLVGMVRTVGQLLLAGVVLKYIFAWDEWSLVLLAFAFMLVVAAWTAFRRVSKGVPGAFRIALLSLAVGSLITCAVVAWAVVRVDPWYDPRYLIPLYGMILGNAMTGVSLALDRLAGEVARRRDEIEQLLLLGATSYQAVRAPIREALKASLIPSINALMVVGIVSLPGMMTGQILAGVAPLLAIRYQIVVMFMLTFAVAAASVVALFAVYRRFFTPAHQLRPAD